MLEKANTYEKIEIPNIVNRVSRSTIETGVNNDEGIEVNATLTTKEGLKLRVGDIILMEDRPTNDFEASHLAVKVGQFLTSHLKPSGSDMVHAMIWTQNKVDTVEPELVEASGKGYVREGHLRWGNYHVWRCLDKNWSDWAAQVGMVWASGKNIPYGYAKSVKSVLGRKGFGGDGKARAKKFIEAAFDPDAAKKVFDECEGAFCSQFVMSAYQAAAAQILLAKAAEDGTDIDKENMVDSQFKQSQFLQTDAYHCSVRVLHARMKEDTKFFKKVGTLEIQENMGKESDDKVWRSELNRQVDRGIEIKDGKIKPFLKPEEMKIDSKEWVQWVLEGQSDSD